MHNIIKPQNYRKNVKDNNENHWNNNSESRSLEAVKLALKNESKKNQNMFRLAVCQGSDSSP